MADFGTSAAAGVRLAGAWGWRGPSCGPRTCFSLKRASKLLCQQLSTNFSNFHKKGRRFWAISKNGPIFGQILGLTKFRPSNFQRGSPATSSGGNFFDNSISKVIFRKMSEKFSRTKNAVSSDWKSSENKRELNHRFV